MLIAGRGRGPRGGRGAIRYVQMGYAVERGGVEETAPYIPIDTYSQTTYVYATKTPLRKNAHKNKQYVQCYIATPTPF